MLMPKAALKRVNLLLFHKYIPPGREKNALILENYTLILFIFLCLQNRVKPVLKDLSFKRTKLSQIRGQAILIEFEVCMKL